MTIHKREKTTLGNSLYVLKCNDISLKSGNVIDDVIANHVTVKNSLRAVRFFPERSRL